MVCRRRRIQRLTRHHLLLFMHGVFHPGIFSRIIRRLGRLYNSCFVGYHDQGMRIMHPIHAYKPYQSLERQSTSAQASH